MAQNGMRISISTKITEALSGWNQKVWIAQPTDGKEFSTSLYAALHRAKLLGA